jgi:hypothetical protein
MFGRLADLLIPVGILLVITLQGFRVIGKRPGVDPAYDKRMDKWGPIMRIAGIIGIVCVVVSRLLLAK